MDTQLAAKAAQVLSAKGAKLHTHEMHIRRTKNGFVAKHDLRDSKGHPPQDGQDSQAEYNMANTKELAAHVAEHMQPQPDEQADAQEPQQPAAAQ